MKEKIVKKIDLTSTFRNLDVGETVKISKKFNYNSIKSATRRLRISEQIRCSMRQDENYYYITRENYDNRPIIAAN